MLCEKVVGNLKTMSGHKLEVDYIDIEWHETYKRLHKKETDKGEAVGIRLDNEILSVGLKEGDVLYLDGERAVAVRIPPCEVIAIRIDKDHGHMLAKVCYEIGNKHAALFWGEHRGELLTPYNEPAYRLLTGLHGVNAKVKTVKLDMDSSIASAVHNHTH